MIPKLFAFVTLLVSVFGLGACAPTVTRIEPLAGSPGTVVNLSMEYLVGWPRIRDRRLHDGLAAAQSYRSGSSRKDVPGTELVWIEDKILQFKIPELAPGEYRVIIHDDKGPPGDRIYSALETTAYLAFPPVWPFVMRSNEASAVLTVLPREP